MGTVDSTPLYCDLGGLIVPRLRPHGNDGPRPLSSLPKVETTLFYWCSLRSSFGPETYGDWNVHSHFHRTFICKFRITEGTENGPEKARIKSITTVEVPDSSV